eukprot:FR735269.1.p2 GENE.FR735269.1~~FR735269.1.p2  ORF type:complete len:112 (+),score=32.99 FR735269.1:679-1014(+)
MWRSRDREMTSVTCKCDGGFGVARALLVSLRIHTNFSEPSRTDMRKDAKGGVVPNFWRFLAHKALGPSPAFKRSARRCTVGFSEKKQKKKKKKKTGPRGLNSQGPKPRGIP